MEEGEGETPSRMQTTSDFFYLENEKQNQFYLANLVNKLNDRFFKQNLFNVKEIIWEIK